jgi:hypothetical protein
MIDVLEATGAAVESVPLLESIAIDQVLGGFCLGLGVGFFLIRYLTGHYCNILENITSQLTDLKKEEW